MRFTLDKYLVKGGGLTARGLKLVSRIRQRELGKSRAINTLE